MRPRETPIAVVALFAALVTCAGPAKAQASGTKRLVAAEAPEAAHGATPLVAAATLEAAQVSAPLVAAETPDPAHGASGPVIAKEDTMHTEIPPVLVSAPRVTLDEILDRVARGEARRDSLMHDVSFLATMRAVRTRADGSQELLMESVTRVYKRRPDQVRTILLRTYEAHPDKKKGGDDDLKMDFSASMGEDIVNFAFQPAARRRFKYHIMARDLVGDHLIYRIAFEPASALDVYQPSGLVWVDTKDFVVVKQEISFRQSPVPLFLKGIRRMTIERERVNGYWVLAKVLMRIETTIPVPKFGRLFDFGIQQTDWAVNEGVADSVFIKSGKASARGSAKIEVGK